MVSQGKDSVNQLRSLGGQLSMLYVGSLIFVLRALCGISSQNENKFLKDNQIKLIHVITHHFRQGHHGWFDT